MKGVGSEPSVLIALHHNGTLKWSFAYEVPLIMNYHSMSTLDNEDVISCGQPLVWHSSINGDIVSSIYIYTEIYTTSTYQNLTLVVGIGYYHVLEWTIID